MQSEIKFVEKYFLTAMIRFATAAESPFFVAITSPGRSLRLIYSVENYPPPLSLTNITYHE